ncbi:DUF3310 domain-containing protein [Mammaliicoccus sciuri]|uniref:DUF3310 domain-containing protein n=1 Tax=Mammaliicoccus sciuri TaxID=1296 RepID=UPI001FB46DE2|nr:DUF3310 domain-containing protein [Mammaliicoccus sciuri]MCJ0913251.1 DUF3310 domain-containing protein [Mammaliicoccus sciuri]
MEIKEGDRIHVKRLSGLDTDFYATLTKFQDGVGQLKCSTGSLHNNRWVYLPYRDKFGPDKSDYYTLATDEEDTEEPVIQRIEHINKAIKESENYIKEVQDNVNHPSHYNFGDIEVVDFIEQVTKHYNPDVAYHIGNAIKYLSRAPHKNGKEDIAKAKWYIERAFDKWE